MEKNAAGCIHAYGINHGHVDTKASRKGSVLSILIMELAMNAIGRLRLVGVVLVVVASCNAWSQSSESPAASTATQNTSKAAVRKANRALSDKVLKALSKGGVDTTGINVLAKNGAVTLAGGVMDASQIEKAGSIAKGVSGVTSVKNALTIHEGGQ
jgi:osmotically-inducible protein OsmY